MKTFCRWNGGRAGRLLLLGALCTSLAGRCGASGIVEYLLGGPGADPEGITLGTDGAYWFVEFNISQIGRIDTNGVVTEFVIPSTASHPVSITTGPDGNLWFTESSYPVLGRINTNGGVTNITEFKTFTGTVATGITKGPDGRLWVLDFAGQFNSGAVTNGGVMAFGVGPNGLTSSNYYNTNLTVHSRPSNITTGPDGNLWFTEQLTGRIGRITTNGVISESAYLPTNCLPYDIITGPDGAMWFTEYASNKVGRIDTNLNLTAEYPLPTNPTGLTLDNPYGLVLANDGSIWYTDTIASCLGQIVLAGTNIAATNLSFTPTTNAFPRRLATGPDGNIWFGEYVSSTLGIGNNIGRIIALPTLNIQNLGGFQVVLSWSTNSTTNFVLQVNGDLTTTNWTIATNIPVVVGSQFVVTNNSTSNVFFRLNAF
jgi:virginiamycin B lyase